MTPLICLYDAGSVSILFPRTTESRRAGESLETGRRNGVSTSLDNDETAVQLT